jgi:hypothetical protein
MTASAHLGHDLFIGQLVAIMSLSWPSGNLSERALVAGSSFVEGGD